MNILRILELMCRCRLYFCIEQNIQRPTRIKTKTIIIAIININIQSITSSRSKEDLEYTIEIIVRTNLLGLKMC